MRCMQWCSQIHEKITHDIPNARKSIIVHTYISNSLPIYDKLENL